MKQKTPPPLPDDDIVNRYLQYLEHNRLMGNSLLDIMVFGRISGKNAALFALEKARGGKLSLDHVSKFNKELDAPAVETDRVAPMLLPDYTDPKVRERQLTARYVGTIR